MPSSETLRPDEEPLAHYAAVSRSALAALALGMASPLILVSPLLVIVPLAAVVVAGIALVQISRSRGQLQGRWPATIGLCLATLFLGWGVTRQVTRQATLAQEAVRFADDWLRLVREGKLHQADQLKRWGNDRIHSEQAMADFYEHNREASEGLQAYFSNEPLQGLRMLGPGGSVELEGIAGQMAAGTTDEVILRYRFGSPAENQPRRLWITVARKQGDSRQPAEWYVQAVDPFFPSER